LPWLSVLSLIKTNFFTQFLFVAWSGIRQTPTEGCLGLQECARGNEFESPLQAKKVAGSGYARKGGIPLSIVRIGIQFWFWGNQKLFGNRNTGASSKASSRQGPEIVAMMGHGIFKSIWQQRCNLSAAMSKSSDSREARYLVLKPVPNPRLFPLLQMIQRWTGAFKQAVQAIFQFAQRIPVEPVRGWGVVPGG